MSCLKEHWHPIQNTQGFDSEALTPVCLLQFILADTQCKSASVIHNTGWSLCVPPCKAWSLWKKQSAIACIYNTIRGLYGWWGEVSEPSDKPSTFSRTEKIKRNANIVNKGDKRINAHLKTSSRVQGTWENSSRGTSRLLKVLEDACLCLNL